MSLTEQQAAQLQEIAESNVRLETQMYSLVGNGQPGRIGKLESKLETHSKVLNRIIGALLFVSAVSGIAVAIYYH